MRDSTIIYRSFWEAIKQLPVEQQAEAWNALFSYSLDFTPVEMSPLVNMVFTLIKPQLDANIKRYQVGVQNGSKGAEHGRKGGRPATTKPLENPQETPSEPSPKPLNNPHHNPQETLNKPPNDNVNVNHNENGNENENQNADLTLKTFSDETKKNTGEENESAATSGQGRTEAQAFSPNPLLSKSFHHSAEHRQRLMQTSTLIESWYRALKAKIPAAVMADLVAQIETWDLLFDSKFPSGSSFDEYRKHHLWRLNDLKMLPIKPKDVQVNTTAPQRSKPKQR